MALTADQARAVALRFLSELHPGPDEAVLMEDLTREEDFGWVFFYQSRAYAESGDPGKMLVGNAPFIVDHTGQVHETGTAWPVDEYIRLYRAAGTLRARDGSPSREGAREGP
jgi:hypothetical protein